MAGKYQTGNAGHYIKQLVKFSGLSSDRVIGGLNDKEFESLVNAQVKAEGMKKGKVLNNGKGQKITTSGVAIPADVMAKITDGSYNNSSDSTTSTTNSSNVSDSDKIKGKGEKTEGNATDGKDINLGPCNLEGKGIEGTLQEAQRYLKKLCSLTNGKLYINSAYRSSAYNQKIGGAKNSMHVQGKAYDIAWPNKTQQGKVSFITNAIKAGFTGIGVYTNFCHVDIGQPRAWGGSGSRSSLPAWASQAIDNARLGGGNNPVAFTNDGNITQPTGTTYIPGMGVVPNGGQEMTLIQSNYKTVAGEIAKVEQKLNNLAQANVSKQDGNLKGTIPISGVMDIGSADDIPTGKISDSDLNSLFGG